MKKIPLFVIVFLLSFSAYAAEKKSGPLWVGVLRENGILIPFSQFDGNKWIVSWPEAERHKKAIGTTLADIPRKYLGSTDKFPENWYLLKQGKRKQIKSLKLVYTKSHCVEQDGIETDYKRKNDKKCNPCPLVGASISGELKYTIPREINFEKKEAKDILDFLIKQAVKNKKMLQALKKIPFKKTAYSECELIEMGNGVYFFRESYFDFGVNLQDPDFINMEFWIIKDKNQGYKIIEKIISIKGDDPTKKDIAGYNVLGSVFVKGKIYYIVKMAGYEWEYYSIVEIKDDKLNVLVKYSGGGC